MRRSSNYKLRKFKWGSWRKAYAEYKNDYQKENKKVHDKAWFVYWCRYLKVKPSKFDRYRCPTCCRGHILEKEIEKLKRKNEIPSKDQTGR